MIYSYFCSICEQQFDVVQGINDKHEFTHCGHKAQRLWGAQVNKDLMYQFTTDVFGKPVEIHSKHQYKSLLKQHGLADATAKEMFEERKRPKQQSNVRTQELVKETRDVMYRDGVLKHLPGFLKKYAQAK